ncbi:TonB-dependent receptor plug domain-containing protein [Acidomonas methanolica]|uniref:TonB-dependent receptor plug domain-containing protein n=1 Tax=Acidomonas methanolica TaxID=437 RepID=UPI00211A3A9E|nr:TonB-dependent receptor [Acidomonas methanolica]MCQ9156636.1 TonB-dependent receptor [Acidomonas methanolica]
MRRQVLSWVAALPVVLAYAPGISWASNDGANSDSSENVIVTGTREPLKKARDSLSPVDIVTASGQLATGQTNLTAALAQILPSVTRPAVGQFDGAPTDYIALRGLAPNQTLILVNGKRRHNSSYLYTDGFADGATPTDIDLIAPEMIDHIEILRDGAAAQYGSDAIAGVVNIILASRDHGGVARSQIGQTYSGDGFTAQAGARKGLKIGRRGFLDLSFDYRHQDHTNRSGVDQRTGTDTLRIVGDPSVTRYDVGLNGGYTFANGIEAYTTATYAHRFTQITQVYRTPSRLPDLYPNGFTPQQTATENDFSAALGLRGHDLLGWRWDLSSTYGGDFINSNLNNTANIGLLDATGNTPLAVHLANYSTTQLNNTLDLSRAVALHPLYSPLNVAFGIAHRFETYGTGAGSPASYLYGGTQAQAGLLPSNAGPHSRVVYSTYLDFSAHLTRAWQGEFAGRYEHYTDFGDTFNGKAATRYDITGNLALRATFSTGTRAPSLANEYYSALAVGPESASGTLAANSAAARLLGATPLKPEHATNLTAGVVWTPVDRLHITLDGYRIDIRDRIVTGPGISGGPALEALKLQGIAVSPTLTPDDVSASFFTNAAATRTYGLDLAATYTTHWNFGRIDWDASLNLNDTSIRHVNVLANGMSDLSEQTARYLTGSTPKNRLIFGGAWQAPSGRWDVTLHEQRFGQTTNALTWYTGPDAYSTTAFDTITNRPRWVTNLQFSYRPVSRLHLSIGANNLFNRFPSRIPAANGYYGSGRYDGSASQIGINGGYYYAQADITL